MSPSPPPAARRSRLRRTAAGLLIDTRPLRRSRPFRRLFIGQLVSMVGRQITVVAVPYQVYQLTHSPLLIGVVGMVQVVPLIVVSIVAGSLADTHDRRRLLLVTQACLAVCSLLLAAGAFAGRPSVLYIYAVVALASCFTAIDSPTRTAIIPNIIDRDHLAGALSLNFALFEVTLIAGPVVAGLILGSAGIGVAYAVDAATFIASMVAIYTLPPQRPKGVPVAETRVEAIARGFRFVRHQPVILGGFALDLVAMVFGLPQALFPVLAAQTYHVNATGLGFIYAAPGVGALIAATTAGWVGRSVRQGRVVVVCVGVWGLAMVCFGLAPSYWWGLACLAVAGGADSWSAVARNTSMQTLTPDELRGRLTAVYYMVVTGGPRLGDLESGVVASLWTAQISVVSGGVLCVLGMVAAAAAFPGLWRYRAGPPAGPEASVAAGAVPPASS